MSTGKPKRSDPEAVLSLSVNCHTLSGRKRGGKNGRWRFDCPSWPELAARHAGAETPAPMIADFVALALAGAVRVKVALLREGGVL